MILSIPSVRPLSGAVGGVNGVSLNTWARREVPLCAPHARDSPHRGPRHGRMKEMRRRGCFIYFCPTFEPNKQVKDMYVLER